MLEHRLPSLNCNLAIISLPLKITAPDPTPCSVYFRQCTLGLMFSRSLPLRELSQLLPGAANFEFPRRNPIIFRYFPSSVLFCIVLFLVLNFLSMGVIPINMQSDSFDVVRNAFTIRMLMRRCTRMYFCLLCSKFISTIHTGPHMLAGVGLRLCI